MNPFISYAVDQIMHRPAEITMEHLARKVGYSGKHLIRIFRDHVGLPPKAFLRIMRFQKTVLEIENHKQPDWTSVAHESGYYDQAHFISDFRHFSGFTPRQYLLAKGEFRNYVAVG
jgi:AraC-like DNA-binding protein